MFKTESYAQEISETVMKGADILKDFGKCAEKRLLRLELCPEGGNCR
jgi:hypothetical protein